MKAIKDFIVHLPLPYSDTIKTENGVELYADKRFSADRLSNRVATVVETPLNGDYVIKKGFQVLVDPTIVFEQNYKLAGGKQKSIFLVDEKKSLYKVDPSLIVLYKENESNEWKGFQQNALYELVKETKPVEQPMESAFIFIPEAFTPKYKQDRAVLKYGNEELLEQISNGDEVIVKPDMGIEYWIDGKTYKWFRNSDVVAKVN